MPFLFSNYPPCRTDYPKFIDTFYELLSEADEMDIAVGYITADSLSELQNIVEMNNVSKLNLTIGMHFFDLFTALEYKSAVRLSDKGVRETSLPTLGGSQVAKFINEPNLSRIKISRLTIG